jgi:hypothetical protein
LQPVCSHNTQLLFTCSRYLPAIVGMNTLANNEEAKLMSYSNAEMNIPPDYEDEDEELPSDGLPHLNEDLADDWQEELLDELGEYSDDDLDPDEVLYGEESTDFDYAYYDNEDEWEGIEGQDEV